MEIIWDGHSPLTKEQYDEVTRVWNLCAALEKRLRPDPDQTPVDKVKEMLAKVKRLEEEILNGVSREG